MTTNEWLAFAAGTTSGALIAVVALVAVFYKKYVLAMATTISVLTKYNAELVEANTQMTDYINQAQTAAQSYWEQYKADKKDLPKQVEPPAGGTYL